MTERVLLDTGPLVALLDRNDPYHPTCAKHARDLPESISWLAAPSFGINGSSKWISFPLHFVLVDTCWPVITEACYLLRSRVDLVERLLETCHDGIYELLPSASDIPEIGGTMAKCRDQQIDLADACLLHLANRDGIQSVMTVDHRHFSLFRTSAGKPLTLIPDQLDD